MIDLRKIHNKIYEKALETSELYDTEIVVGEKPNTKTFRLHSLLLKFHSLYFRTALSNNWIKIEDKIIKLEKPNISVEVFDIITKYIYSGIIYPSNNFRTNVDLLIAADELCFVDLCSYIVEYIVEKLKKDKEYLRRNFILIQQTATKLDHLTNLSQFYKDAFQQDPSLTFEAGDFITIDQKFLLDSLIENNHSLKPVEIWDKLLEWCRAQSVELKLDIEHWTANNISTFRDLIHPFIQYIDFKNIYPEDFSQKVKPYRDVFDSEYYIAILEHYSFSNSNFITKVNSANSDPMIDSKIINPEHASLLVDFIKKIKEDAFSTSYDFNLLIRGTDNGNNGFKESTFYESCEEKGPTITFARVKNTNEILGGFNTLKWKSYGTTICGKENFIFSLDKNDLKSLIVSKVNDVNKTRRNDVNKFIPDFGDLYFLIGTKEGYYNKKSYEKLIRGSGGRFEIDEYEVFQVISKL
ncbi:hypothetical protein C1646_819282 [Rhizophagus diaphanus]|nr:hypothetical protein C1646_819282 [Rhizophagus diaphanus] [Rhizophagus sp. MUCL 43196]